ncbi:MAG: Fmu (Sun) domain-containing protein [Ginsengibacter sp.]
MNKSEQAVQKSYVHRYLDYARVLLENYNGREPFHLYLKKYFSLNKKHGSKDRRIISSLCYDYFRLGAAVSSRISITQKLLLSVFLVENKPSRILKDLEPSWNEMIENPLPEKVSIVKDIFDLQNIFPFNDELSTGIDVALLNFSFLIQPKLFIRIRPGKKKMVLQKLKKANISFEILHPDCLSFANSENINRFLHLDDEAVIQDYNSQQTLAILKNEITDKFEIFSVWDCCAASGGKSILAYDLFKNINLTVSDTRKNILKNLSDRFKRAGITNYFSFVADLSAAGAVKAIKNSFDVIIADVPCSGSGTWARTPEQLLFFQQNEIEKYALLQRQIVMNAMPFLKPNGYLLYITCSVFKKENEENVAFFTEKNTLTLINSEYLKGYEVQADTLFVALIKKN